MTVLLNNLAIAGYRSFGASVQRFESFAKVNVVIGRNNSGKSNVLRFLSEIYGHIGSLNRSTADPLAHYIPTRPQMLIGAAENVDSDRQLAKIDNASQQDRFNQIVTKVRSEKARLDGTTKSWSLYQLPGLEGIDDNWRKALEVLPNHELQGLWGFLTRRSGGSRVDHWEPETIGHLRCKPSAISVEVIPAIRQVGRKGTESNGFDGAGIIERLAKLQNPGVLHQADRQRFHEIRDFLRYVLESPNADLEIPHDRETIIVHMDGRALPLESLGSGVHEVIILAAAATVLSSKVVCIEEPELHLNPVLQKKLLRYISTKTGNQYFITTHSAAFMDAPDIEIYHVKATTDGSVVTRVTTDRQKCLICEDLGYHPSDLLQANCILWVEGPSDRLYLKWWLTRVDPDLIEGVHFSIMFYGGRLAAHITNAENEELLTDFISLRRLNSRGMIVMDSDKSSSSASINNTKSRLQTEFDKGPGHAWVTQGREIENYIPYEQISAALDATVPTMERPKSTGRFANLLKLTRKSGATAYAPKVDVAHHIVSSFEPDFSVLDLGQRLQSLRQFILESNPKRI